MLKVYHSVCPPERPRFIYSLLPGRLNYSLAVLIKEQGRAAKLRKGQAWPEKLSRKRKDNYNPAPGDPNSNLIVVHFKKASEEKHGSC